MSEQMNGNTSERRDEWIAQHLPLTAEWERVGVRVLTQITANLTIGMYTTPGDLIDSLECALSDLKLSYSEESLDNI